MFKLFKDLTRPPEPLSPRPTAAEGVQTTSYTPRQPRGRSPGPSTLRTPLSGPDSTTTNPEKEVEEKDEDAKRVVELLKALEKGGQNGTMHIVETLSQLHAIPSTVAALGSFRRHRGFTILQGVLTHGLAWKKAEGVDEEEIQVMQVQRMEGVRLAFQGLGWALNDRDNRRAYETSGGYLELLSELRHLSPPIQTPNTPEDQTQEQPSSSLSSYPSHHVPSYHPPDAQVLAHLLAHVLNDNYTILSILQSTIPADGAPVEMGHQLGEIIVKRPDALPLLWAYLCGVDASVSHATSPIKGKGRARDHDVSLGGFETKSRLTAHLVKLTFQILLAAVSASIANLFAIRPHLPYLPEFLITRLYCLPVERKYDVTFPPREGWYDPEQDGDNQMVEEEWCAPEPSLRKVYLALLRRLLEAGVDQKVAWRLFGQVKTPLTSSKMDNATSIETQSEPLTTTRESSGSQTSTEEEQVLRAPRKTPKPPPLHIDMAPPTMDDGEKLDPEVLDLLRHAMKSRWPDVFVFRGGSGESEDGLVLPDIGRAWPAASKGFHFSCWVYITKLNRPITLLHVSRADQPLPFFRLRILENSQIALFASVHKPPPPAGENEPLAPPTIDELICSAPDALIPHHQWVHFALGCRKPKGADMAEVRIFVNGTRVGAMKMPYPVPPPHTKSAAPHTPHAKPDVSPDAIRLSIARDLRKVEERDSEMKGAGKEEENEWMLGRTVLIEDSAPEDIVMLLHHLGPRYNGNFQEALGKFLTYEGATSINIYLSNLAQDAADKRLFTSTSSSVLVRAIRQSPALLEENLILALSAKDAMDSSHPDTCVNAASPHPFRARQLRHGTVRLVGNVEPHGGTALDESISCVGGGTVILKMIDLSSTSEELATTLGILRDMVKESWSASEEMERIRGFELLAAILRPKMANMMDTTCTKIILSMLGINMDKPKTATVHNSVAYRALGLEFELWSHASLGVVTLYFQHFEYLLSTSKHARYNVLRTFQKAAMVRKMLYALRSNLFDLSVVPVVVDALRLALVARWSGEDAIKPIFSYLVSALCQGNGSMNSSNNNPPPSQAAAAQILATIAELSHQPQRLVKLNKSIALHRLLIMFISSNSAYYVIMPCLDMLELCLSTPGLESFQRSFEGEGGFALLARTLGGVWRADVQSAVFRTMLDKDPRDQQTGLHCMSLMSTILSALDFLLQTAGEDESGGARTPKLTRSETFTSVRSVSMTPIATEMNGNGFGENGENGENGDTRLQDLLTELTAVYRASSPFRRLITGRRVEQMLPALADFAAVSASSNRPDTARPQQLAAAEWLQALIDKSKLSNALVTQIKLILEQLSTIPQSPKLSSSVFGSTPSSPRPTTPSYFGSSFGGRFSSTPPASPSLGGGGMSGPIPRRRPSTEAGYSRPRSIVEKRMPLKRVLTGESVLEGGKDKKAAWKLIIIRTDSQNHSKMILDRKEHWQRLSEVDWPKLASTLRAENGLWPDDDGPVTWRLDGSEGPLRMRNRLERVNAAHELGAPRSRQKLRDAIPSVDELSSAVSRMNVGPWEDPFALALGEAAPISEEESPLAPSTTSSTTPQPTSPETDSRLDDESFVEVEENKDDKLRRIAKTIQAGDVVEETHNIVRIVGVDACPGLLILGKRNLYLVDSLVQTGDGEVIDAKDAPRDVLTIPGTLADFGGADPENHMWSYNEIVENNKRAFLFRDVALELYFSDKRNFLIVFKDKRERQGVVSKLTYKAENSGSISRSVIGNFVLDQVARAMDRSEQQLEAMTRKWQNREISNFAYLQLLNQHANRTPNDVTQYPVFPWVLADYTSQILDLEDKSSYRDLTMPMGALTPARREVAVERYNATDAVGEKPFHYGTHYSSSMIVCSFMIRLSPFTEIFLALQGGSFDLADRLFSSIPRAWDSACADNRGDVRELIPEFFYSPAFLKNVNRHDFGRKQVSGDSVDDVVLPPWALDDPLLFINRHREALESDVVSKGLPQWIDLTFGRKQRDPASFNCFHPLSYRGAVDLERLEDEGEKAASTAIIHNFGQTPEQIFKTAHPNRFLSTRSSLPITQRFGVAEQWQLLLRSILPITETTSPIHGIVESALADVKPATQQRHRLVVPGTQLSVQFGFADSSLRMYYQEVTSAVVRLVLLVEGISIVHAIFAGPTLLVTVSEQGVITAWRLTIKGGGYRKGDVTMTREATLRGHTKTITCLAASTSWSILVSGSEDGTAMVWDMNRLRYTRALPTPHGEPIKFAAINESDGHIALASTGHLYLFSINGYPIAGTHVNADPQSMFDFTLSDIPVSTDTESIFTGGISFLTRDYLKSGVLFVIGVGSEIALYRCVPGARRFEDEQVNPWKLVEQGRLSRSDDHVGGDCCMVKFLGETLYAGFEPAKGANKYLLYQWSLPDGPARNVPDSVSHTCMAERCGRHFGLLEPKRYCGGCGGVFCGTHAVLVESFTQRYCGTCRGQMAEASALGLVFNGRDSAYTSSSRPVSRRPSFTSPSRPGSKPGSRSQSRVGSRRPSVSTAAVP